MYISDKYHSLALSVSLYDNSVKGQYPNFAASFGRLVANKNLIEDCKCTLRSYANITPASRSRLLRVMASHSKHPGDIMEIHDGEITIAEYYYHTSCNR